MWSSQAELSDFATHLGSLRIIYCCVSLENIPPPFECANHSQVSASISTYCCLFTSIFRSFEISLFSREPRNVTKGKIIGRI